MEREELAHSYIKAFLVRNNKRLFGTGKLHFSINLTEDVTPYILPVFIFM